MDVPAPDKKDLSQMQNIRKLLPYQLHTQF